nr:hypothetical protein [Tanacetum cinerariifolium]
MTTRPTPFTLSGEGYLYKKKRKKPMGRMGFIMAIDHASSVKETEPFETDESAATPPPYPAYRVTARIHREPVRDDLYRFVDTVERGEGSTPAVIEVGYGITDTWDDLVGAIPETAPTTVEGVNQRDEIRELRAGHCKLQAQFIRALTALKSCQNQLTAALGHIQILEAARVPAQPEGVARVLTTRDADRNTNGDDSHNSRTCARRTERVTHMKKKTTDKYCPRGEMKKLESELWNLRVKSNDVVSYNQRFQELALLCVRMFPEENKRQNTGKAYTAGSGEKKSYGGSKPLCPKFNYHHDGPCPPKCYKCNKVGHIARDCRGAANVNTTNNQRGNRTGQKPTCYEYGSQGHFKKDCLKFRNNNRGTQGGNATAPAKVYAVGRTRTNPDSNVIMGTFLLNNRYASILFDTGADRSFVSTAFSSQIAITLTTLDHYYDVELADERQIRLHSLRTALLNARVFLVDSGCAS